jgi:hypothetical protein
VGLKVEGIFEGPDLVVGVVELEEGEEVAKVGEDLIVAEEVEEVLVGYAEVFLLVALLAVDDEVIEEDLVEVVEVLFEADPDALLGRFLVIVEAQFLCVVALEDAPKLLEGVAAKGGVGVPLLGLQLLLLQALVYAFRYPHVLLHPPVYALH